MTIARDNRTGEVVGQVCEAVLWDRAAENPRTVQLLTRDGRYVTVPRSSVRLEELR